MKTFRRSFFVLLVHSGGDCVTFQPRQLLLHIPHSSINLPETYKELFFLNEEQIQAELLTMTDLYVDDLFSVPEIPAENKIVFSYSRLICDVERFKDDTKEIMAPRGMGVCYSVTHDLKPLKNVTPEHRAQMQVLYDHHHAVLTDTIDRIIEAYGEALLIDCHSYSSQPLPYEMTDDSDVPKSRPDICLGTDLSFHTPVWLRDFITCRFEELGYSVVENEPFSGTIVPMKHYHSDRRALSVMIEVKRGLYMDEENGLRKETFGALKADITTVLSKLCSAIQ